MSAEEKIFRFRHTAMATEWEFLIRHADLEHCDAAAVAAFAEIDRLEDELSRFRPHSDVGRIPFLKVGEPLSIGFAAWDCFSLAKDVWQATNGAFDVSIGPFYELWKTRNLMVNPPIPEEEAEARSRSGSHLIELDPHGFFLSVKAAPMRCDLGALGKGYTLDQCAVRLKTDWEIDHALLSAGGSSLLGMGHDPNGNGWLANAGPDGHPPVRLLDNALSTSGFGYQGAHIINPRTGRPVSILRTRLWATAPTAALSDALSTAFLVMEKEEVAAFCLNYPETGAMFADGEKLGRIDVAAQVAP